MTVTSNMRTWKSGEAARACQDALHLAVPSERPDSRETSDACAAIERTEHDWWLRNYRHVDDEALLMAAAAIVQDRKDFYRESSEEAVPDQEVLDAYASYAYSFKHFDIEFQSRRLPVTMMDIFWGNRQPQVEAASDGCGRKSW